ncbi:vegetative cell wall protein gp1-like [Pipistrellus kuhlii]|uniref:vegetative cell wall protein gp1-like n=1 Tax=Pipistrellus kuhlii TaxID=59472 RepID=UPI001E2743C6|nr:vegetative cell wall protein gp1-like [Pipistrellus kuhlii]
MEIRLWDSRDWEYQAKVGVCARKRPGSGVRAAGTGGWAGRSLSSEPSRDQSRRQRGGAPSRQPAAAAGPADRRLRAARSRPGLPSCPVPGCPPRAREDAEAAPGGGERSGGSALRTPRPPAGPAPAPAPAPGPGPAPVQPRSRPQVSASRPGPRPPAPAPSPARFPNRCQSPPGHQRMPRSKSHPRPPLQPRTQALAGPPSPPLPWFQLLSPMPAPPRSQSQPQCLLKPRAQTLPLLLQSPSQCLLLSHPLPPFKLPCPARPSPFSQPLPASLCVPTSLPPPTPLPHPRPRSQPQLRSGLQLPPALLLLLLFSVLGPGAGNKCTWYNIRKVQKAVKRRRSLNLCTSPGRH